MGSSGVDLALDPQLTATYLPFAFSQAYTTTPNGVVPVENVQITAKGTATISDRRVAYRAQVTDGPGVNQVNVTAATNASPIVITAAGHGYATGDKIAVQDVGGNTAANGLWTITVIDANTFSLNGSIGNGAYTSGGYVTNRPMMTGLVVEMGVNVQRGGLTGAAASGDDVAGVTVQNSGNAKGTDAVYVAASSQIIGNSWGTSFNTDASCDIAFRAGGTYTTAAAELCGPLLLAAAGATFGSGDVRLQRTAAGQLTMDNGAAGTLDLILNVPTWTTATAGSNGALPITVQGYIQIRNQFGTIRIPYYPG